MRFYFHEYAETEFDKAVAYYEDIQPGLGLAFAGEVYQTIKRIQQFPEACSTHSRNTRRCLVNRFPFGIIYQLKSGTVCIIAVADLRRRPGYWLNRV